MTRYACTAFGWITIIEAKTKREALKEAKARAPGVGLRSTDIQTENIRPAKQDDIDFVRAMGGRTA